MLQDIKIIKNLALSQDHSFGKELGLQALGTFLPCTSISSYRSTITEGASCLSMWEVTLIIQDIEDAFQQAKKASIVLINLTTAYDAVWHCKLHLMLLLTIQDCHIVAFIMEILTNHSFILHTSDGQQSRLRWLKNGVPHGSVLAPMLFFFYIYDILVTAAKKYGYADDIAILSIPSKEP